MVDQCCLIIDVFEWLRAEGVLQVKGDLIVMYVLYLNPKMLCSKALQANLQNETSSSEFDFEAVVLDMNTSSVLY